MVWSASLEKGAGRGVAIVLPAIRPVDDCFRLSRGVVAADLPLVPLAALLPRTGSRRTAEVDLVAAAVQAISDLAAATNRPVVLGVDDAHLLDLSSAVVVHQAVVRGHVSLLATARAGQS